MILGFETILPFLRPIERLIRDDSITEIMVNGSSRIFVERDGVLEQLADIALTESSLMVAVKNIARRLGDDISETKPISPREPDRFPGSFRLSLRFTPSNCCWRTAASMSLAEA